MLSLHFILSLTDVVEVFSSGINTWYPYLEKLYCIVLSSHLFISWNLLSCGVVNFCMNEIIMTWKYCFFLRWPKLYCSFLKFFLQLHSTPVAKYPINLSSVPSVILNYFRLLGWHCSQNSGNFFLLYMFIHKKTGYIQYLQGATPGSHISGIAVTLPQAQKSWLGKISFFFFPNFSGLSKLYSFPSNTFPPWEGVLEIYIFCRKQSARNGNTSPQWEMSWQFSVGNTIFRV
jgi:hypothetical protein